MMNTGSSGSTWAARAASAASDTEPACSRALSHDVVPGYSPSPTITTRLSLGKFGSSKTSPSGSTTTARTMSR